jgi:hypothetical protein
MTTSLAARPTAARRPVRTVPADLALARSCYDHLAGTVGVAVTEALVARGALAPTAEGFDVDADAEALRRIGVDVAAARAGNRRLARSYVDWTERRPHVAGTLGAALLDRLLDLGWVCRTPGSRVLHVSEGGRRALADVLGISLDPGA